MPTARVPPIRRFFQLQIPQRFRPTITSVLAKTLGRVNLETPAVGLTAIAYWARFSRWCSTHPVMDRGCQERQGTKLALRVRGSAGRFGQTARNLPGIRRLSGRFFKNVA